MTSSTGSGTASALTGRPGYGSKDYGWGADGLAQVGYTNAPYNEYSLSFDPQGSVVQRHPSWWDFPTDVFVYDAFGARQAESVYPDEGIVPDNRSVGYAGQWGGYTELETGLVLMGYRYYDPASARFLTRDPIGYDGGLNLYGYCGGDPVNNVDPDGLSLRSIWNWTRRQGRAIAGFGARAAGAVGNAITAPCRWVVSGVKAAARGRMDPRAPTLRSAYLDPDCPETYLVNSRYHAAGPAIQGYLDETAAGALRDATIGVVAGVGARGAGPAGAVARAEVPWATRLGAAEEGSILTALDRIRTGSPPSWPVQKWGAAFTNREGLLPAGVSYAEYYLPKAAGDVTRWGANRLVIGSDARVYFTWNHYGNFVRVR